uniref:RNA-directed RNA polymerase n=2 Tax=Parascaris univalens TaxID=6257 RepID=A0A915C5Y6_PARUN
METSVSGVTENETSRIKAIISSTDENKVELLKSIFLLMNAFMKGAVVIGETIIPHRMGDHDYCEPWTELDLEVSTSEWNCTRCLGLAKSFQQIASEVGLRGQLSPILQFFSKAMFIEDCIPAHLGIALCAVHFGNLVSNGLYLAHFTRHALVGTDIEQSRCLEVFRALKGHHIKSPMIVDFEHDRDVFVVRFAILDGGFRPKNEDRSDDRGKQKSVSVSTFLPGSAISVKVRYISIRRIVVDTIATTHDGVPSTHVYFQLNYPPEIRKFQKKPGDGDEKLYSEGNRWRTIPEDNDDVRDNCSAINDSPTLCLQFTHQLSDQCLYEILSRIYARIALPFEFTNIAVVRFKVTEYVPMPVSFVGCDHRACAGEQTPTQNSGDSKVPSYEPPFPRFDLECYRKIVDCGVFGLEYLIAALMTRGAIVKDQILVSAKKRDEFVDLIVRRFRENKELTLESLERLLNVVDETKQTPSLLISFEKIRNALLSQKDILEEIYRESKRDGYQRVRKVVITPTRMLFVVPELLMGNRVLRNFDKDGNGSLRVQFRDDDSSQLRRNTVGPFLIQSTVFNTLTRGIHIGSRHFVYLGSSNSQLRDNGCYFFDDGKGGHAKWIRTQLGKFDRGNIPKMMSRMGQCFTQAKQCAVVLKRHKYNKTWDVIGGRDSKGEPYIFSDGVGRLSQEFAEKIAKDINLANAVPSCFQIRHRGMKGVLSVDPLLDSRKHWAVAHGIKDGSIATSRINDLAVVFRPSQDKFKAPRDETIEIVKYSSPTCVSLNRPMISILDQVSSMQGHTVHMTVTERIHELLDMQLMELAEIFLDEDRCRDKLNELPRLMNVDRLSPVRGFALTQEPFFRSLLLASVKYTLKKQLAKEQILIPSHLGRSMFGVMDETGQLQSGQIFVQYTNNVWLKNPPLRAAKTILKGPVLMTKNPCIVAGDVRLLEAVDIPELHHLVDVVVFPQYGPRPHPDEMAGSDLDGDEYSVIWDKKLMFVYNENPLDFTKRMRKYEEVGSDKVDLEMRKFFVNYIKQDSIGSIANAFLVNADLYGITSEICENIAKKHSQAVDFPKTGDAPEPLTKVWTIGKGGSFVPPERSERWPDFMCKNHEPSYISPRLVGQLYRRIRLVDDVLTLTSALDEVTELELDPMLQYPGWEKYAENARTELDSYNAHIRAILDNYGIQDEGQLLSGCISVIRNRISDRDVDDMSFFNTNHVIEKKVASIFRMFRHAFFREFGGYERCTEVDREGTNSGSDDDERRVCLNPTYSMRCKASAYYVVCYREAAESTRRLLSFGWLAWDVLCHVKQEMRMATGQRLVQSLDPLSESFSLHIAKYCRINQAQLRQEIDSLIAKVPALRVYCRRYLGLENALFVLCKWAELQQLFGRTLRKEHICLLFLQFGLNHTGTAKSSLYSQMLEKTTEDVKEYEVRDMNEVLGGLGKCILRFLRYLSSRIFERNKILNFMDAELGYRSVLLRGQWLPLHKAAVKTFYKIVLTGRFDDIPLENEQAQNRRELLGVTEIDPFMIELPDEFESKDEELCEKIQRYSGAKYVRLRRIRYRKDRVILSAVGTLESLNKLRELVSVRPTVNATANDIQHSSMIGRLLYRRLSAQN